MGLEINQEFGLSRFGSSRRYPSQKKMRHRVCLKREAK